MKNHGEIGDTMIRLETVGIGHNAQRELDRLEDIAKKTWYISGKGEDFTALKEMQGITVRTLWGRPVHDKKR